MKKIKLMLAQTNYINIIGSILLISIILLILILFTFYSSHYIAHFSIASFGLIGSNNYYIVHPEINFERNEFREQRKMNELFKQSVKEIIKKKKLKEFYFTKYNFFMYQNKIKKLEK